MEFIIRDIKKSEYCLLNDFLYEAIFVAEGMSLPSRDIIKQPELKIYTENFGQKKDDKALVAVFEGKIVGAIWARIMSDYGHIDNETPSLAMSLYKEYRGQGIGTKLLGEFLELLEQSGYKQVSLSVQKANYAVRIYKKADFQIFEENDEEYIMRRVLRH
ncbi:hypothetical protein IMSAG049_00616 [Clostridiales bacterium]|nr:hypothetical protein IMSAG049_00616 [Clostridiales bacterium]